MRYKVEIEGLAPGIIQHNGAAGLDTRSLANQEIATIAKKRGVNRTELDDSRLRELECQKSIYYDGSGAPTLPEGAIRSMIETSARKRKQGPQVREGLIVERVLSFEQDVGKNAEELGKHAQFTVGVKVGQARVLRTRALFPEWKCTFLLEVDPELCDREQIETWLDIGGRRIGLGDWRPEKSGVFGRFKTNSIQEA